jgi:CRP-like cAMP-binding protein
MTAENSDALDWTIRKMERLAELDEGDRKALAALPFTIETVPARRTLIREGAEVSDCCVLVSGYACRHKTTASGVRQIVSFDVRGDILDVQHLLLEIADHNVQAITDVTVAWVPKAALRRIARERPKIGEALWRDTLIDASIFREWVLNVGRRDAKSRIAHMLCEFALRCRNAGLGAQGRLELPMTQEQIADATGLTPIHVNRMLRLLGEEGAIERAGRHVRIGDWKRLREIADFDPVYLHAAA